LSGDTSNLFKRKKDPLGLGHVQRLEKKAREAGDLQGLLEVADCYFLGKDVEVDNPEALKRYTELAKLGVARAFEKIGGMYSRGDGVTANRKIAFAYYLKGAEKGDRFAIYSVVLCYEQGLGTDVDLEKASFWKSKVSKKN